MPPDPRPVRHRQQACQKLARQLAEPGLDCLLVSHPLNVGYLTGFSQLLFDPDDPMRAGYLLDV